MTMTTQNSPQNSTPAQDPAAADKHDLSTAALALRPPGEFRMEMEPRNLSELFTLASTLAKTGICGCTRPEDVIVRALTGRDLGLTVMQSLRAIYNVEGRPALDASLIHALCLQHPLCEEFKCIKTDAKIATYRVKRRGEDAEEISFTIEQADAAGLLGRGATEEAKAKSNWSRWRPQMLRARAKSEAARMKFPEAIIGMYSAEEIRDGADRENELVGEVVPNTPPTVHAAERDFDSECLAFEKRIETAGSGADMKLVRTDLEAWDAPEQYKKATQERYAAKAAEIRKAKDAPKEGSDPGKLPGVT